MNNVSVKFIQQNFERGCFSFLHGIDNYEPLASSILHYSFVHSETHTVFAAVCVCSFSVGTN
jgi:hypothetical protein